jgi:hypothetical protein
MFVGFVEADPIPSRICVFQYIIDDIRQIDPNYPVCFDNEQPYNYFPLDDTAVFDHASFRGTFHSDTHLLTNELCFSPPPANYDYDLISEENNNFESKNLPQIPYPPHFYSNELSISESQFDGLNSPVPLSNQYPMVLFHNYFSITTELVMAKSFIYNKKFKTTKMATIESYNTFEKQSLIINASWPKNPILAKIDNKPIKKNCNRMSTMTSYAKLEKQIVDREIQRERNLRYQRSFLNISISMNDYQDLDSRCLNPKASPLDRNINRTINRPTSKLNSFDILIIFFVAILILRVDFVFLTSVGLDGLVNAVASIGLYVLVCFGAIN